MTKNEEADAPEDDSLRRRLIKRIAAAAVVIAGLLVGLAVFDRLNRQPSPAPATPVAQAPEAAKAPEQSSSGAVTPPAGEQKAPAAVQKAPAAPEETAAPTTPPSPKEARPLTKPATAKPALHRQTEMPPVPRPEPSKEIAKAPAARPAPAASPLARAIEAAGHYIVQLGVFSNVANAEELHAKLQLNGIPSQIEARVQVGPFKSRQDAEQARQKLTALGLEPGIILSVKK